jgi:hypothetical protein
VNGGGDFRPSVGATQRRHTHPYHHPPSNFQPLHAASSSASKDEDCRSRPPSLRVGRTATSRSRQQSPSLSASTSSTGAVGISTRGCESVALILRRRPAAGRCQYEQPFSLLTTASCSCRRAAPRLFSSSPLPSHRFPLEGCISTTRMATSTLAHRSGEDKYATEGGSNAGWSAVRGLLT